MLSVLFPGTASFTTPSLRNEVIASRNTQIHGSLSAMRSSMERLCLPAGRDSRLNDEVINYACRDTQNITARFTFATRTS